ncbi:hypothetical protein M407DRAFT_24486 [Tulasnella calospora MUT 4182]|uniref:Major facilitator superfamily (MFS) profile domain-containing protein n=1 Tax=Tulasnella calospora MUT 4182 TaxID=1051891 RepID=A0A0C3QJD7_9AGAM|nr:hypothetical protein M407DRAFT_24486 [Tulasnella calospora MUT 4182]
MASLHPNLSAEYLSRSLSVLTPAASLGRESGTSTVHRTVHEPSDGIELSRLPTLQDWTPTTELPTPSISGSSSPSYKSLLMCRIATYGIMTLEGWSDATAGPLLPVIQRHYNISFIAVSMLFVMSAIGYALGAIVNVPLTDRYGLGNTSVTVIHPHPHVLKSHRAALQILAYATILPALPFPVICTSYTLVGFTIALQNAQTIVFISSLPGNASSAMGLVHGFYGIGASAAPLVATQVSQTGHWSYFYLTSLGLASVNIVFSLYVFRLKRLEELIPPHENAEEAPILQGSKYGAILRRKRVHLLAAFAMVYVGAEVTIGGWIITFLQQLRGGGPSAGYVSSAFFGGLTLGRFILWPLNDLAQIAFTIHRSPLQLGKRRAIYLYMVAAAGLELVVWLLPNLITNVVAVTIVGMALGPMYPIVMNVAVEVLPKRILSGSIGYVASTRQVGSALFPFLTGLLATKRGVQVLQPWVIGLFGLMATLWLIFMLNTRRRTD